MLNRSFTLFLFLFVLSVTLYGQFEGSIEMKITLYENGKPNVVNSTMYVKKDLLVSEVQGKEGGGKFIVRGDKKVMWIIDDDEKMYVEISLKEDVKKKETAHKEESKSNVKKTGKMKTILGYECEEWIAENERSVTSLWGTEKLGNIYEGFVKAMGSMSGLGDDQAMNQWQRDIMRMNIFPLRIEVHEGGKMTKSQEITKIEPKTLPASMFDPPKGYEKQSLDFDINKMMQQEHQQDDGDE